MNNTSFPNDNQKRLIKFLAKSVSFLKNGQFVENDSQYIVNLRKDNQNLKKRLSDLEKKTDQSFEDLQKLLVNLNAIKNDGKHLTEKLQREINDTIKKIKEREDLRDSKIMGINKRRETLDNVVVGLLTLFIGYDNTRISDSKADLQISQEKIACLKEVTFLTKNKNKTERKLITEQNKYVKKTQAMEPHITQKREMTSQLGSLINQLKKELVMNEKAINVGEEIERYAKSNSTTIDKMSQKLGIIFDNIITEKYSLLNLETILQWRENIKGEVHSLNPEMLSMKQFINHSLIPHLDYFIIHALQRENIEQLEPSNYKNLNKVGKYSDLKSGVREFTSDADNKDIASEVAAKTNEINIDFINNNQAGTIHQRFNAARNLANANTKEFEKMLEDTKQKILQIITQKIDSENKHLNTTEKLENAKISNVQIQKKIQEYKKKMERLENDYADKASIKIGGGFFLGIMQIVVGTYTGLDMAVFGGFSTISNTIIQGRADYRNYKSDKEYVEESIKNANAEIISEDDLGREIKQIEGVILELLESKVYQEKYGKAGKLEAIKKSYLAKSVLDFGVFNMDAIEESIAQHNINSVDSWINSFDVRMQTALINFCFGAANSNDLSIILAESNAISEFEKNINKIALKNIVEGHIKTSISEHYAHASQVDVMKQTNITNLGSKLYEARVMVRDASEDALKALFAYQLATQPALMEGQYNARGAKDIRRTFEFWQHRHGDIVLDNTRIREEGEPFRTTDKKVSALPLEEEKKYVEMVKRLYGNNIPQYQIGDDFLRVCTFEYLYPKFQHEVESGKTILADNPQLMATYPIVNGTINRFIKSLSLSPIENYQKKIGGHLDNLLAQTFIDFFEELGSQHVNSSNVNKSAEYLQTSKNNPILYPMMVEKYIQTAGVDAYNQFPLFLNIYKHNLEKILEIACEDDRNILLEQIRSVEFITAGKLYPKDIAFPGSELAKLKARNENHTFENTNWKNAC